MFSDEFNLTGSPVATVENDAGLDTLLGNLIGFSTGRPIEEIPGLGTTELVGKLILPAVADLAYKATGTVYHLTGIANHICVCKALDELKKKSENRILKTTITRYPINTSKTPGNNGSPDILYPLGWVCFGIENKGFFERKFIQSIEHLHVSPTNHEDLIFAIYLWPGVECSAEFIN